MDITKEEMILMRAITWMSEDADDGIKEAQEIVEGLKSLVKLFATPVVTTRFYYFDCWDRTGELQTKPIKATCEEHATLLFEKEFGETHRYDPPYN